MRFSGRQSEPLANTQLLSYGNEILVFQGLLSCIRVRLRSCRSLFSDILFVTVSSAALQTQGKALGVSSHFRSVAMGFLRYLCFGFLPGVKAKIRTRTHIKEHKDDNCFTGDVPS